MIKKEKAPGLGSSAMAQPRSEQAKSREHEERAVELRFSAPDARLVKVAGTFNNWQPERNPLQRGFDGIWRTRLSLTPGRHEYCFVVDGQWKEDPLAKKAVLNPYGGRNSVMLA